MFKNKIIYPIIIILFGFFLFSFGYADKKDSETLGDSVSKNKISNKKDISVINSGNKFITKELTKKEIKDFRIIEKNSLKSLGKLIGSYNEEIKNGIKKDLYKKKIKNSVYPRIIEKDGELGVFMSYTERSHYWDIEDLYKTDNKFHSYVQSIWHNNMENISKYYSNDLTCINFSKSGKIDTLTGHLLEEYGIYMKLTELDIAKFIGCYISKYKDDKNYPTIISTQIKTKWADYRQKNLGLGISTLNGVWKNGEELSALNKIFSIGGYANGMALRRTSKGVESFPVYGGGTCGVSTLLYQNVLKVKGLNIVERKPHTIWYRSFYNTLGADATIFGGYKNGAGRIDFRVKNNTGNDFFITTKMVENSSKLNRIVYEITFTNFNGFDKNNLVVGGIWKNKYGRKCNTIDIMNKGNKINSFVSCYTSVFYD